VHRQECLCHTIVASFELIAIRAAGVAASVALAGTAANKPFGEKNDASLNNMYFAWRAAKHL
jgi:hypothetical protein